MNLAVFLVSLINIQPADETVPPHLCPNALSFYSERRLLSEATRVSGVYDDLADVRCCARPAQISRLYGAASLRRRLLHHGRH